MSGIVVGVDGSAASTAALTHSLVLSSRLGVAVAALHCWQTPVWVAGPPGFPIEAAPSRAEAEEAARSCLRQAVDEARRAAASSSPDVAEDLRHGDPARELIEASGQARLLAVGGRSRGVVARLFLGSVTDELLHHAACPVLVVPDRAYAPWQRVVVGLDGSENSRAALRWAATVARALGIPLTLVRAWMLSTLPGTVTGGPATDEDAADVRGWLRDELARCGPLDEQPLEVDALAVHLGATAALLGIAGRDDLLVVGARGQGGFAGLVLGSVAMQCARHAKGSLAVVPDPR